jgi:integral membrane protein
MFMLTTPLGRFRAIAFFEGLSFLVLLLVAMPLKYIWGMPGAVRVVGMTHGLLFIAYVCALLLATLEYRWGMKRAGLAFTASLVPGGTFWLDVQLRREQSAIANPTERRS